MNEIKINKCGCGGMATLRNNNNWKCIVCDLCGNSTAEYSMLVTDELVIDEWNTAHPELSNAMQAVRWLEEGKKIIPIDFCRDRKHINTRFKNRCFGFGYCDGDTNKIVGYDIENIQVQYPYLELTLTDLFSHVWQLYEEPKFILGTFKEAREHLKAGKRASVIHSQEKIEFDLVRQKYGNYFLCNEEKQYAFQLQDVDFDSCAWRLYEA